MRKILFMAVLLLAGPLHAQSDPRSPLLRQLYPGIDIRLTLADRSFVSPFVRASADTIQLESGAYALADAQRIEVQQRATRRGLKTGAVIGAVGGAGFGGFIMFLVTYMCESDCSENKARDITLGTLAFSAAGAASGALVGSIIGAATPQWFEIKDPRVRIPAQPPATRIIGSLALTPAYARYSDIDAGGPGVRVAYTFHAGPLALGPEAGAYWLDDDTKIQHLGGVARLGTGADKRIEPFGSLGVGFYSWGRVPSGSIQLGGYSAGAGIHFRSADRKRSLFTEARWQDNLTYSGDTEPLYGFYTIGIGGTLAW